MSKGKDDAGNAEALAAQLCRTIHVYLQRFPSMGWDVIEEAIDLALVSVWSDRDDALKEQPPPPAGSPGQLQRERRDDGKSKPSFTYGSADARS